MGSRTKTERRGCSLKETLAKTKTLAVICGWQEPCGHEAPIVERVPASARLASPPSFAQSQGWPCAPTHPAEFVHQQRRLYIGVASQGREKGGFRSAKVHRCLHELTGIEEKKALQPSEEKRTAR
jgi:hypothetical protein